MKSDLFSFDESLSDGFNNQPANQYEAQLKKARVLCIRGRFEQALAICEGILDEDIENMGAYIEILRVHSKDFNILEGEQIEQDIYAIERLFPDIDNEEYLAYLQKRNKKLNINTTTSSSISDTSVTSSHSENTTAKTLVSQPEPEIKPQKQYTEKDAYNVIINRVKYSTDEVEKAKLAYENYANNGSASALCNLGYFYSVGMYGYLKDNKKAFNYTKKSAALNYPVGMYNLATYYYSGIGTKVNLTKAFEYYKMAADLGDRDAMCETGLMYYEGKAVPQDLFKAYEYLTNARKKGNTKCLKTLKELEYLSIPENAALEIINNQTRYPSDKVSQAIKVYEEYAKSGSPSALCNVGYYYSVGKNGYSKDVKKAFEYCKRGADLGSKVAMYNVGLFYSNGTGVEKDNNKSYEYYKKSADAGYVDAIHVVGYSHYFGVTCEKNLQKAAEYLKEAADMGNVRSMCLIGECYRYGKGVSKDVKKAVEYYRKAARQGNRDAKFALNAMGYSE